MSIEEIRALEQPAKRRLKHPDGWQPGLDTERGTFTSRSMDPLDVGKVGGEFADQLRAAGFTPEDWLLEDDKIEVRTWPMHMGSEREPVTAYYFKARIFRKGDRQLVDYKDLIKRVRARKPKPVKVGGDWTYVLCLADWQIGKRDGDGTAGVISRVKAGIVEAKADIANARRDGYDIGTVLIAGLGDIVEGCTGFYPQQEFTAELDRRGQMRVAVELLYETITSLADTAEKVKVVAVGGNHGENRKNGKSFTTFADNDDVAVFEQVERILAENPEAFDHVRFTIPNEELSLTVDVGGTVIGFTHGHIAKATGTAGLAHVKLWNWWRGQAHGRSHIGDADVLVNGHFHYFNYCENGARTHIQVPALDHSTWFEQGSGYETRHGMVSFVSGPAPVDRLRVLRCQEA